jgi:hemerythrin
MTFMAWSDKLSVGIRAIDEEHKGLLSLINELYDAIGDQRGRQILGKALDELVNYTKVHFADEEELFRIAGYPQAAEHKRQHEYLTKQVLQIQERYNSGAPALTLEVMTLLKDWLFDHILVSDIKYGTYLNAKGIR